MKANYTSLRAFWRDRVREECAVLSNAALADGAECFAAIRGARRRLNAALRGYLAELAELERREAD